MPDLVMVIEDEKEIRDLVKYNLERAGFKVSAVADGDQGLERLFASRPDALVLDLMLPGKNGLEILREVRNEPATRDLPVIVLTARAAEMDKLLGFEHGADDYLTKPFSPRELVARAKSALRRAKGQAPPTGTPAYKGKHLFVDFDAISIRVDHASVTLTRREFELLKFLIENRNRVISRDRLLERVWGFDLEIETRSVDVHVSRLRAKLGTAGKQIETVIGMGYRFSDLAEA